MIRGTTPTLRLTVRGNVNLTQATDIYVSIRQKSASIELHGDSLEVAEKTVKCWLTQEDSLRLTEGPAKLQVNWTYTDALTGAKKRDATQVISIDIDEQLLKRTI